jgi:hypothetical protein
MSYDTSVWPARGWSVASFLLSAGKPGLLLQAVVGLLCSSALLLLIVWMIRGRLARAQERAQLKWPRPIMHTLHTHAERAQSTRDMQQPTLSMPLHSPAVSSPVPSAGTDTNTTQQPQSRSQQERTNLEKTVRLGVVLGTDREHGQKIVVSQYARRPGLCLMGSLAQASPR